MSHFSLNGTTIQISAHLA